MRPLNFAQCLRILMPWAILVLAACGRAFPPPIPTQGPLPHADWLAYHDTTAGFSILHPPTWQRTDDGSYPVVFALPATPGTNLIEKTLEINVKPAAAACRQSSHGGTAAGAPEHVTVNGTDFLREGGSGIAAGNIYDWTSYSTLMGTNCVTLTFVLHSSSSGVYPTEPAPFDKPAESAIFTEILSTFRVDG
jgi:hypothetical protein